MADGEDPLAGGSYSQLLFADDDNILSLANSDGLFGPNYNSSVYTQKPPKMLCFGGDYQQQKQRECDFGYPPPQRTTQKSGITCSDSSSTSYINNARIKKKRNGYGDEAAAAQSLSTGTGAPAGSQRSSKKIKSENPASGNGHAKVKVRKEKLGERISALQQLVSPFGKSDTASVIHEATGYIKFLHDQVQVLCSPYLQRLPSSNQAQLPEGGGTSTVSGFGQEGVGTGGENESRNDLRSRGLCLVPVDCTMRMASNNGADFWSPAAMGKNVSSAQR